MSKGFIAAMTGIAMTLFAWYGPWAWPAWPAFTLIDLVFGNGGFSELPYAEKATAVVVLIVINVAVWAVAAYVASIAVSRRRRAG